MEQFSKTVFGIVMVLCCLQASARPFTLPEDSPHIDSMRKYVDCTLDSTSNATFYAPETGKDQCITTALDCVKRELDGTVRVECEDKDNYTDRAIDYFTEAIERLEKDYALTNSSECACERWNQVPFSEFLNKVEKLLQYIDSR